jgi:hypothetical protein
LTAGSVSPLPPTPAAGRIEEGRGAEWEGGRKATPGKERQVITHKKIARSFYGEDGRPNFFLHFVLFSGKMEVFSLCFVGWI